MFTLTISSSLSAFFNTLTSGRGALRVTSLVVLTSTALGCAVYDPSLLDGCRVTEPPRPPSQADDGTFARAFALYDVQLSQSPTLWRSIGVNLDGYCTTSENPVSECVSPTGATTSFDGDRGTDNNFGQYVFSLVSFADPNLESSTREGMRAGRNLPIIWLREWNSTGNDPRVRAAILNSVVTVFDGSSSPPVLNIEGAAATYLDGSPTQPPNWASTNWAYLSSSGFLDGDLNRPIVEAPIAYVRDGTLVVVLPERAEISFGGLEYSIVIRLTNARITAQLDAPGRTLTNITVTGRWALNDMLATAGNVGICPGSPQYTGLVQALEAYADVRSLPGSGGPTAQCDAVSVGIRFEEGRDVRIGGLTPGIPVTNPCEE